mmetsp:Transcript_10708/g.25285  ORF Transcript_10708/g.25285 Transcript_10708/m.25285 type:complete len:142 (-) Transcript_10708:209-634(-)
MALLYHATTEGAADAIERSGFECGSHGFAGGAIYFSSDPDAACRKFRNGRGNPEIVIECLVDLGTVLEAHKGKVDRRDVAREGEDHWVERVRSLCLLACEDPELPPCGSQHQVLQHGCLETQGAREDAAAEALAGLQPRAG